MNNSNDNNNINSLMNNMKPISQSKLARLKKYEQDGYILELITPLTPVGPYIFKSLGFRNPDTSSSKYKYFNGHDFPIGTHYQLKVGKFPLKNYKDLVEHSEKDYILYKIESDVEIPKYFTVKLRSVDNCNFNKSDSDPPCQIIVKKKVEPTVGGRKKSIFKKKSNRKKSNRRH
jgi:hypothetical protein